MLYQIPLSLDRKGIVMSEKRRDSKGRLLRNGEVQRQDGLYMFRYTDPNGKRKTVYSWKLVDTDKAPEGKRSVLALRDIEKQVLRDLDDGIRTGDANSITVNALFKSFMDLRVDLKETTRCNYICLYDSQVREEIGGRKIRNIRFSDIQKLYMHMIQDLGLKARTKIGGSDASAIVGMNPYKSNVELWKEKAYGIEPVDISDKPYVKYGTEAEPLLRELFKLDYPEYQVCYEENNIWFNDKYPWAHASLDGWLIDQDGRKGIWECKTTNILQSMQKEKWDHRIPDNYYIQVLHYLMVTEFDYVVLKAQLKSVYGEDVYLQTRHYPIERSEVEEDIKYLIEEELKFWEHVQMKKAPALKLPEI